MKRDKKYTCLIVYVEVIYVLNSLFKIHTHAHEYTERKRDLESEKKRQQYGLELPVDY